MFFSSANQFYSISRSIFRAFYEKDAVAKEIDGRNDHIDNNNYGDLAKKVCHRRFSVGADGLLVVKDNDEADVEMVYYNSDGSRASMCGNGLRCFAKFVYDNNIVNKDEFKVYTLDGIKIIKIDLE